MDLISKKRRLGIVCLSCLLLVRPISSSQSSFLPLVINTWPFTNATLKAWETLRSGGSPMDALVEGCSECERLQCDGTVGFGGSPDENGETTLDAMVMNGTSMDVGAVAGLRRIKDVIKVARAVMVHTKHTLLVGKLATQFALSMNFEEEDLSTNQSFNIHNAWRQRQCQPNFWMNVSPDPSASCGPYSPQKVDISRVSLPRYSRHVDQTNHDTIGMIVTDADGHVVAGTSTNGANHKIPGRVGDSPIPGAGAYADTLVGGAVATGDGDVLMRFLPSYLAVEQMRNGISPLNAASFALQRIVKYYPDFKGALVTSSKDGRMGAACHGFSWFAYSFYSPQSNGVKVTHVHCT